MMPNNFFSWVTSYFAHGENFDLIAEYISPGAVVSRLGLAL